MLLAHAQKNPALDVIVKMEKTGSVIAIDAVNHRAGWKLSFEQGPIPDGTTEEMTSESALLSVCKTIAGHIDEDDDGVPDAHFGNDSALQVENTSLKEDLAKAKSVFEPMVSDLRVKLAEAEAERDKALTERDEAQKVVDSMAAGKAAEVPHS